MQIDDHTENPQVAKSKNALQLKTQAQNETSERLALTVPETLEVLPISKNSIYAAIKAGTLPSVKIGGKILIPRHALEKMFGVA